MVFTHITIGMALSLLLALVAPEFATVAAIGGAVGGAVPDVDLLVGEHRRTLHFPVLYWPPAIAACALALAVESPAVVAVAVAVVAAAVHSTSDVLGTGEELQPWERTNPDAVYDHLRGQWLRARYVIRYDGAPEDLALTVVCATPIVIYLDGSRSWPSLSPFRTRSFGNGFPNTSRRSCSRREREISQGHYSAMEFLSR